MGVISTLVDVLEYFNPRRPQLDDDMSLPHCFNYMKTSYVHKMLTQLAFVKFFSVLSN